MPCEQCGSVLEMTDSSGGVKEGSFTEQYRCVGCDARGTIKGRAEEPANQWKYQGSAFNDGI